MRFQIIALASAAAALTVPATASANHVNATEFAKVVEHDDLDLTTTDGVAQLDVRIRTRINQMCRTGGRDSASIRIERNCRISAFASARPQVRFAIAQANAERARFAANTASPASDEVTPGV